MRSQGFVRVVAGGVGAMNMSFGVWSFVSPRSFSGRIATFPPYNEHLLHDIGAFQIGLGAVLLAAVIAGDALFVALAGAGAGSAAHVAAHVIDADLGGRSTDVPGLGALALLVVVAAVLRWRDLHSAGGDGAQEPARPSEEVSS